MNELTGNLVGGTLFMTMILCLVAGRYYGFWPAFYTGCAGAATSIILMVLAI